MFALLALTVADASATAVYNFPDLGNCPPSHRPCLRILDQDASIVPPDYLLRAELELPSGRARGFALTLEIVSGELEILADKILLDPREAIVDERAGTYTWTIPVTDTRVGIEIAIYNTSRDFVADYALSGQVVE